MKKAFLCVALLLWSSQAKASFIINGDFESGNIGFTTQYNHSPGLIGAEQSYDILTNPFPAHPSAASYGDHTTGSGLMMAVNEANEPYTLVWSQTVNVATGANYDFSIWMSSWVSAAPTTLDIQFNSMSIGTPTAPSTTAVWEEFSTTWNSGSATSVNIEIYNVNGADVGGDFALDDISLNGPSPTAVPEPSTVLMLLSGVGLLGGWGFLSRRKQRKGRGACGHSPLVQEEAH